MIHPHYSRYKGRGAGRILHALECYCPYHVVEHVQIGDGEVYYQRKLYATYTWKGDTDIPVLTFIDDPDFIYEVKQRVYQDYLGDLMELINNDRVQQYNDIMEELSAAKFIGHWVNND